MVNLEQLENELNKEWSKEWLNIYLAELQTITEESDLLTCLEKICAIWRGNGKVISEFFTWQNQLEQINEATKENFTSDVVTEVLGQAAQSPGILVHGSFMW